MPGNEQRQPISDNVTGAGILMTHSRLGVLCIFVLAVILTLGLWPFHAPTNEVTWLKDRNGIRFGDYGTVTSTGSLDSTGSAGPQPCSLELWLEASTDNGGAILSFYAPDNPLQLSLNQSHTDLLLQSRQISSPGRARLQSIVVNDVFREARPVFVTITSGAQTTVYVDGTRPLLATIASSGRGTLVYANGTVPGKDRGFQIIPCDCTGRFIVGDSPRPHGAWSGQVKGLAIYASELTAPTVRRHYDTWTTMGRPVINDRDHTAALYLFDERAGSIVHNRAGTSDDLFIPPAYTVLDQPVLRPDWDEFSMSWGYWMNNLKNVAGFIPLGMSFCAYFALIRKKKRAGLVAVMFGFAVSLTIEVFQGYLPTRDSGTTDLITNTLGTWLGVILYRAARAQRVLHMLVNAERDL
jgi:hypothetical protein